MMKLELKKENVPANLKLMVLRPDSDDLDHDGRWVLGLRAGLKAYSCLLSTGVLQALKEGWDHRFQLRDFDCRFVVDYRSQLSVITLTFERLGQLQMRLKMRLPKSPDSPIEVLAVESAFYRVLNQNSSIAAVFSILETKITDQRRM